jgi:ATP-dependent exoDNAse (exonuclease V) alpha subunit
MIPLILCWAVTIHKVQGLTLDKAVIHLDCFDHHMEYVALSRLKTLNGLAINNIKHSRFINNKIIYQPAYDEIYKNG